MIKAAGILFLAPDNTALFIKRSSLGDHEGEWCLPGGGIEDGETAEQCALREANEEIGALPEGLQIEYLARTQSTGFRGASPSQAPQAELAPQPVDFTTFVARVKEPFTPTINEESSGWAWAPVLTPPLPVHPGVEMALSRLSMTTELDVAIAIAEGRLTSPQQYANSWLFAMRITGTGMAYRNKLKEFVWRDPDLYMNERFKMRCNGLPVILNHPKTAALDTKEYAERNVGSIFYPYLLPDRQEVWGIARIIDAPAAALLEDEKLSTSPSVVFASADVNSTLTMEDGSVLLIEGEPSLIDHLAICERGVWDKGGDPSGIESATVGESNMVGNTRADDDARKDEDRYARMDATLDKLLSKMDALDDLPKVCDSVEELKKRMDSYEEERKADASRKDAEEKAKADAEEKEKADSEKEDEKEKKLDAKKDSEKEDEKEKKADAEEKARQDAQPTISQLQAQIEELRKLATPRSDDDRRAFADVQARADATYVAVGDSAPAPMVGESIVDYRIRLLGKYQEASATWKGKNLSALARADATVLDAAEQQIYADAVNAVKVQDSQRGGLRKVERMLPTGHREVTFHGDSSVFLRRFSGPRTYVNKINQLNKGAA